MSACSAPYHSLKGIIASSPEAFYSPTIIVSEPAMAFRLFGEASRWARDLEHPMTTAMTSDRGKFSMNNTQTILMEAVTG